MLRDYRRLRQIGWSIFTKATASCAICLFWGTAGDCAITDELVAYYSFDDGEGSTLKESTGMSSDGELFNFDFENESNWAEGQIDGALSFDGIDDYVIVPEAPLAEEALSVSIWGNAVEAGVWASLVKNWGSSMVGQFHFGLGPGGEDTLNIFITDGDFNAFNVGTDLDDVELETWEHYAFVANPAEEEVTLYRNGEIVDQQPYIGIFTDGPNSKAIGIGVKTTNEGDQADLSCCPGYWNGLLDDLGIWHRALTAAEITDIYTRGLAGESILGSGGPDGDFDGSGVLDATDIDLLNAEVLSGNNNGTFDLTGDGLVDSKDRFEWVEKVKNTYIGDSNLDGTFNSSDFVAVFIAGEYEDGVEGNSTWATGDWNGDTEFDSSDFVAAFTAGGYELGPRPAVANVPEPSSISLILIGMLFIRRRKAG